MGHEGLAPSSAFLLDTRAWKDARGLQTALIVAVGYYLGCLAGFALRFPGSGISFFWPPTAILTAALLLTSPRAWSLLLASAFAAHAVAHAQDGVPIQTWPLQFLGNATQAILAATLVRKYHGHDDLFADARRVVVFIAGACCVAPAIASLIPAYAYVHMGWAENFVQGWRTRAVSNGIASLTLLPCFVVAAQYLLREPIGMPRRWREYLGILFGMLVVHSATASIKQADLLGLSVTLYAPMPFLLWATVRFGGPGLSWTLLWTTVLTILHVTAGHGALAAASPADTVIGVQLLIAANAVPLMLIVGLLNEGRRRHSALLDAESQTRAILRALPDLMFLQRRDGVYLKHYANTSDHMAVVPQSVAGRHMHEVLPLPLADRFALAVETATSDMPSVVEYTQVVSGEPRRYEGRFIAVDEDRVLSVIRDITERWRSENSLREAQRRYALATAAGGVGVWEVDVETQRTVDGRLKAMLGYGEDEIGDKLDEWLTLVHPADRDGLVARWTSFLSGSSGGFDAEYRVRHKDGTVRWIASSGAITARTEGRPVRALGTYTDITDRKESARALIAANDILARAGRITAMAEFSGSIAHELRQPLAGILANAHAGLLAMQSPFPLDVVPALEDIMAAARRAAHIIEHTQQMFTNRPAERSRLNLNDSIRDVLEIAEGRLREWNVVLDVEVDPGLPDVLADSIQMQQVLLNLIVNAVQAMQAVSERSRVLRISPRRWGTAVVVSVRDAGTGFGSDGPSRLFEPFYTTRADGIGMGLTICRAILKSHDGRLWAVANRDGVGSTFRFRLPALKGPVVSDADIES